METRERIIQAYCNHLREHGKPPETVFVFCKELALSEREFFTEFPSLEAVESAFWEDLVARVVLAVEAGSEWAGFTARQRLLSFLYAFCEESLDSRSLLLLRLSHIGPMEKPAYLKGFERRFKAFAKSILLHGVSLNEVADRGRLSTLYPEALYLHFRSVVDFHLKDDSRGYERTDAFIEKTVAVAFDFVRTQIFDSSLDLVRFLIPAWDCHRE